VSIKVYQYPKCSTCRRATKWLDERGVQYTSIDIVERPPSKSALARIHKDSGLPIAKLFNTSGKSYREGDYKAKLATMSRDEALAALAADGKLIKRPLVAGEGWALVGFSEDAWTSRLG